MQLAQHSVRLARSLEAKAIESQKQESSTLRIVFLTLFLDLVGFSIIFPIFPALAEYYTSVDPDNFFLRLIFDSITALLNASGAPAQVVPIVLFGGVLGSLYSLLQFLCAPFWGALSDRIGRRPVLLISIAGLGLSYVCWFFAGSFTLLILARLLGGVMSGNISAASAIVADVTPEDRRSRGMAVIGIAFALGFIIGPMLGGVLSLVDLTEMFPGMVAFGLNPFSMPALFAGLLSCINLLLVVRRLPETLPPERRKQPHTSERSINPLKLFMPLPYPGVSQTNNLNFLFLTAFSGMEFTLTFLAVERLNFSPMQNGYMFIFVGFILTLVQGGIVRRHAHKIGERRLAFAGLLITMPGLIMIGLSESISLLYAGLFFMSLGSALVIPCITALVSLYAPAQHQGRALGVFRSLGALARVIGPALASIAYWKFGSAVPYYAGAVFLILPLLLMLRLPEPAQQRS